MLNLNLAFIVEKKIETYDFKYMKGFQLPIISNIATTGHKLQGASVDNLFVHAWNYSTNWVYVILSRVRTMKGLYFREKLYQRFHAFELPKKYKELMSKLKIKETAKYSDCRSKGRLTDTISYSYNSRNGI